MFYDDQAPWLVSAASTLIDFIMAPSSMGLLGQLAIWKVVTEKAKKKGGTGQIGLSPFKSMRDGDWWVGGLEKLPGVARQDEALVFAPSSACADEFMQYVLAPPRKVRSKNEALFGPEKSAIEMGEINENFQVFIRVRPQLEREIKKGVKNCFAISNTDFPRDPPPQRIVVQENAGSEAVKGNFVFNRIFEDSHTQEEVYSGTAKAYVADFLAGTNVTIFAYGQTGTGKTYTIMGPSDKPGIIPLCLADIFNGMPSDKCLRFEYAQLYLDDWKDLLVDEKKGELKLVDTKSGVRLENLTSREASNKGDILAALQEGGKRRATRAQDMNEVSSRSHAILMLRLCKKDDAADTAGVSTMFIVDLAGSERVSKSGVSGQGFDEATSINQSLTALGRVVVTLIDAESSSKAFIPYNASPLTLALKGGLGGNSKTALIACVTQAEDSISESVSTLRFAMQASHVKNKVASKEAKDKANQEKDLIASAGNELVLSDGCGSVSLNGGAIEIKICGSWQGPEGGRIVVLLGDLTSEPAQFKGLIDELVAQNCQVLAVKMPGSKEAHLEEDTSALAAFFDWVGVPQAVVYGRDWGGIRALRFKMAHPKRVCGVLLEDRANKIDEAEYKKRMKADPGYCMQQMTGPLLWITDGTFPKTLDGKGGANVKGYPKKSKTFLLWPHHTKGKHDPKPQSVPAKISGCFAKCIGATVVDSYKMSEADIAAKITSCFS
eukprot:TRINITY_DN26855_c0_g1_i1.p1 TRINITY_DN26855_c0_g1~~TRINITY_DN26855_c0_g1_i1.p1  ORF type:complete len:745 (+),score=93.12 TRINITY_DN26855_c0_g1_i1:74-2236(+)